jgi:Skp family chaperone for outer membrane proteins
VEVVEQCVKPKGEQMAAYTKLKGHVNSRSMPEEVAAIKKDQGLKADLDRQKAELDDTHEQVERLNEKIRKLEAANASDQEIRKAAARREAALDSNITQGMSMFCTLACSTAKLKDSRFVQTLFRNAGMTPMLSVLMGPDQCSDLCTETQRALAASLLGH